MGVTVSVGSRHTESPGVRVLWLQRVPASSTGLSLDCPWTPAILLWASFSWWSYELLRLRIHSAPRFPGIFFYHRIMAFSKEMHSQRWGQVNCWSNSFLSSLSWGVGSTSWWPQCRMLNLGGGTQWEGDVNTRSSFGLVSVTVTSPRAVQVLACSCGSFMLTALWCSAVCQPDSFHHFSTLEYLGIFVVVAITKSAYTWHKSTKIFIVFI